MCVTTLSLLILQSHMHTESAYDGFTAYCYPEQAMVDHLLRMHMQSQRAFCCDICTLCMRG